MHFLYYRLPSLKCNDIKLVFTPGLAVTYHLIWCSSMALCMHGHGSSSDINNALRTIVNSIFLKQYPRCNWDHIWNKENKKHFKTWITKMFLFNRTTSPLTFFFNNFSCLFAGFKFLFLYYRPDGNITLKAHFDKIFLKYFISLFPHDLKVWKHRLWQSWL